MAKTFKTPKIPFASMEVQGSTFKYRGHSIQTFVRVDLDAGQFFGTYDFFLIEEEGRKMIEPTELFDESEFDEYYGAQIGSFIEGGMTREFKELVAKMIDGFLKQQKK